jgi:TonB family protein
MAMQANSTRQSGVYVSLLAHAAILAGVLLSVHHAARIHIFETRGGKPATVLYWAAVATHGPAANATNARVSPNPSQRKIVAGHAARAAAPHTAEPLPKDELLAAAQSRIGSESKAPDLGGTGSGAEDASPAFPVYSPRPQIPDPSLLPASDQNVVVDVHINAQGQVMDETLVHGLGNRLDQRILDAVRSWRFQPAMVNGAAVASVSELVFPLNPRTLTQQQQQPF